jgi:hypothetical protein
MVCERQISGQSTILGFSPTNQLGFFQPSRHGSSTHFKSAAISCRTRIPKREYFLKMEPE